MQEFFAVQIHPSGEVVEPCLGRIEAQAYVETYNRVTDMTSGHAEMKPVAVQHQQKPAKKNQRGEKK